MPASTHSPGQSVTALLRRSRTMVGVAVIEESGIAWTRAAGGPPDRLFQRGWTGFRQPAWKRLHGLPGIRNLTAAA